MRQRITITATLLLVLAGCDPDRGVLTPAEPRLTKQASTTLPANGTDTLDDTQAFRDALALANVVNVPAGTYYISDQITLDSNNHLIGAGEAQTKIIQRKYGYNFFYAAHATNVRVEGLRFEAPADSVVNFQVALRADNSSGVYFYNNRAINVGLIRIHNVGTPAEPNSMADRSSIVRIEGNAGVGPGRGAKTHGIAVAFSDDVRIMGNYVDYYNHGIAVWGGQADPSKTQPTDPPYTSTRWTTNVTIANNVVRESETGIVTMNTEGAFIHYNRVESCTDVCLDAEGGKDITFSQNTGIDAANGVLATFFRADNIVFDGNTVYQHGRYEANHENVTKLWNTMFGQNNGGSAVGKADEHRIFVRNNKFYYRDTATPQAQGTFGVVAKHATARFEFTGNNAENTRLDLAPDRSGHALVSNNYLLFTRPTGSAGQNAIYAGNSWDDVALFDLTVTNNTIESTVAQSAPAIWVPQWAPQPIASTVCGNTAISFPKLLHVNNQNANHVYYLGASEQASTPSVSGGTVVPITC
ncbi:MAG: right-handed parallel beta-helix repeat-containing protein [Gemmatimonadota bacterium]